MTSENELDILKNENKEELINDLSLNNEEPPAVSTIPPVQEPIEDEQINIEKPKRAGRKKREAPSISDIKADNLNNDNAMDTQPLFEQPIIVEGKRSRKPTSRLELSDLATPKKELSIPLGHGKPLGEIEYINYQITHAPTDALSHLRNICFGRRASKTNIQNTLRDFKGFEFERESDEYQKHLSNLIKLKKDQLQSVSDILGLPATGRNDEHAERILQFLMEPIDEGKEIPERKLSMRNAKIASTNSKESLPTDEEENEIEEKTENGDDEIFDVDFEEEEEEEEESDDDYIGSDEESGLHTKDDPDDFVYQPGKKVPKKRPSLKRSRTGTTQKRKRGAPTKSKRGRKKSKVIVNKKVENEDTTAIPTAAMQTNDDDDDNGVEKTEDVVETKNDDLNNIDTKLPEQNDTTTTNISTDIIPTTS